MQKAGTRQTRYAGGVTYVLTRKKVRNLNMRITKNGEVAVSANPRVTLAQVDAFVAAHAEWVQQKQQEYKSRQQIAENSPVPDKASALALFAGVSEQVFPLFREILGGQMPQLTVRNMSTRWGVCNPSKRHITLALGLAAVPLPLIQYVVLHEYCHFVHPNHQPEFWALMERYMPDAKARRRALRQYPCKVESGGKG